MTLDARENRILELGPERLCVLVPGPPVPCGRPRVVSRRNSRFPVAITPEKTVRYEMHVRGRIEIAMLKARWVLLQRGPFRVEVDVFREADRGDLDNYVKSFLDGATKAHAWVDDRHVHQLAATMHVDRHSPRLEATIVRLA